MKDNDVYMFLNEIGSEFNQGSNTTENNQYYSLIDAEKRFVLSGRTALNHIAKDFKAKRKKNKIAIPFYCCSTMIEPFLIEGFDISFYISKEIPESDIILIMDYFGFISDSTVKFAKMCRSKGTTIIVDATQTAFSKSELYEYADYLIVSYRKWTDCLCAAVYSRNGFVVNECELESNYVSMWRKAAELKSEFLSNRIGEKSVFLEKYSEANNYLAKNWINYKADISEIKRFMQINSDQLICKRRENAQILLNYLKCIKNVKLMFSVIRENDCPMFVPIIVEDRNKLRQYLISKSIYCPVHWPITDLHKKITTTSIYNEEISLVCDQRYEREDMLRIISVIDEFYEKEV